MHQVVQLQTLERDTVKKGQGQYTFIISLLFFGSCLGDQCMLYSWVVTALEAIE